MGTISVSLPSDGTTADVADYNTPITTIVNAINGGLDNDNIASGAAIAGSKLADASITNAKLSTATGEIGAASQAWTPSPTGFSGTPTSSNCTYIQVGKMIFMHVDITGTSNATTFGFTLPVAPRYTERVPIGISDNSGNPPDVGMLETTASSTAATIKSNLSGGAFTASGTKAARPCWVMYETT